MGGQRPSVHRPGSELKFLDDELVAKATIPTTGAIITETFNHIAQGTGESQRIGRKATLTSIHLKGYIRLEAATHEDNSTDRVRVMVVQDKQANGAAATVAQVLESQDINSFRNLENTSRFHVLYDKTSALNSSASISTYTGAMSRSLAINIRRNIDIEYSGTSGAIAEQRSNNVFLIAISESGNSSIFYHTRTRFRG